MSQRDGIDGKTDYGERWCDEAVEKGESNEMGAESKWDKGEVEEEIIKNLYM